MLLRVFCRGRIRRPERPPSSPSQHRQRAECTVELGAQCWQAQGAQLSLLGLSEEGVGRHFPRRPAGRSNESYRSQPDFRLVARENGARRPRSLAAGAPSSAPSQAKHALDPRRPPPPPGIRLELRTSASHLPSQNTSGVAEGGRRAAPHTHRPVSPLHFSPPPPLVSAGVGPDLRPQEDGRRRRTRKKGRGLIKINGCPIELVEPEVLRYKVFEPILLLGRERFANMDIRIRVKGGGYTSQIYAIRQAIAKSVVAYYQKCAPRPATPPLSARPSPRPLAPSPSPPPPLLLLRRRRRGLQEGDQGDPADVRPHAAGRRPPPLRAEEVRRSGRPRAAPKVVPLSSRRRCGAALLLSLCTKPHRSLAHGVPRPLAAARASARRPLALRVVVRQISLSQSLQPGRRPH